MLVTGGAGFIGSHLLEQLLTEGANVTVYAMYNSADRLGCIDTLSPETRRQIAVCKGDLRDAHAVMRAMKGMEAVFHLGALIAIPYSYQSPADVVATNVLGTLNVAEAALANDVSCLIHTSTSEVYGSAKVTPMAESHPLRGQSPYAASKIGADKVMESFYCSYGLPVKTIRPFNAYGPRQSMRAVIPTIINQALHRPEIRLGNTSATRDFTFVEDTARAFVAAAVTDKGWGEVFNAGSGTEIAIDQIAQRVLTLTGRHLPIVSEQKRQRTEKSEVGRLLSDSRKIAQELGWRPSVPFTEGLQRTIAWMERHPHLYRSGEYVV